MRLIDEGMTGWYCDVPLDPWLTEEEEWRDPYEEECAREEARLEGAT